MTAQAKVISRKVVPRWHSLGAAMRQGELSPLTRTLARFDPVRRAEALAERTAAWREAGSRSFAADLVATSLVLGPSEESRNAAEFVAGTSTARPLERALARRLLGTEAPALISEFAPFDEETMRVRVREFKRGIRTDPRTAILWAELARAYASANERRHARRAMEVALALAPEDRFLLRSAARLYLHLDDPEAAHSLLADAAATRFDPWLASAEIAIAPLADRKSKLRKHGAELIERGQFAAVATSELASALATETLGAGRTRQARRLFHSSLNDPTENAVAQAEWVSRSSAGFEFEERLLEVDDSYEARAQFFANEGSDDAALDNAWLWLREQPFASGPAMFGSYHAALARDYEQSVRFAEAGLIANPDEFLLRNNLVFAMASADNITGARAHLARIEEEHLDHEERVVLTATKGLLAFREGDVDRGRSLYNEAMSATKDPAVRAVAGIIWAREEILAHTVFADTARRSAEDLARRAKASTTDREPTIPRWLRHLTEEEVAAR